MPVPAGPRRAAPPRKKPTPKSSSTPSVPETAPAPVLNSGEVLHDSPATADVDAPVPAEILQGDREPEIGVVNASVEAGGSIPASTEESVALEPPDDQEAPSTTSSSSEPRPGSEDDPEVYLKPKHDIDTVPELAPEPSSPLAAEPTAHEVPALQETSHDAEVQEDDVNSREENPSEEQLDVPQEPTALAEDEEEDEEARRKRIAERVAKMGGFNPFGSQPVASPPAVSPPSALPPTPFAIDSPLSFKTVTSPPEEDVPTIGGVQNDIDVEIPPSMTRKDSASSESPEVTRKKSSSSVPIPYGVMQQGGPANPSEEEEEDDEDDEGHGKY
ncbi:hypothetical protein BV25DRAFT_1860250 [Artomyces pyxidatus]|uniref:Uncharacterized protein n=1 Tax=Artomyces pyxidatus TaxID=48021 RepID=A0ACB8SUS3_9AGAM|nr:hypothetical protein BV25DRAFT_1860250 [Artomyces pyxidatus]